MKGLTRPDTDYLRRHFRLPRRGDFDRIIRARGLCQADLVLALLGGGRRRAVERLVGRPIMICPPDPRLAAGWPLRTSTIPKAPPSPDDRIRVVRVGQNPRLPTTGAFQRFKLFKVGLTVSQLLARGLDRRDIRINRDQGHVEFSK